MIAGQSALVTGGGTGAGRAIALALAQAGVDVTICGRRLAPLETVAQENERISAVQADVTDEAAMRALHAAHGPFDIVVANAGAAESAPAHKVTQADWQAALAVNLTGAFLTVQPAIAPMAKRRAGRIIFIASTAGLKGYAYVAPYVAAKHGVVGLMRALAAETAKSGVTVKFRRLSRLHGDRSPRRIDRAHHGDHGPQPRRRARQPRRHEPARPFHNAGRDRGHRAVARERRRRVRHRSGHFRFGRRDMVSAPLTAGDGKERVRLWLRLLRATRLIEAEMRERLKAEFDTTLPRFDVMAALDRQPGGMMMSELSRFLLVSNGNVTGIVDRLVSDGLVARTARDGDRRAFIVKLTEAGATQFKAMAAAHERCGFLLACSEGLLAPEGGEEEHGDRQDLQSSQQHAE